eukprot:m.169499 g.169499  ORF g.169499 m.169499 type:complete len:239 (-) comp25118_c0_seq5:82-798(-)
MSLAQRMLSRDESLIFLNECVWKNNVEATRKFLESHGGDPNMLLIDLFGCRPLLASACAYDVPAVVDLLLQSGINANGTAQDGCTALMCASACGRSKVIELLLKAGADINLQDKDGSTALMCASHNQRCEVAEMLVNAGADMQFRNKGETALDIIIAKREEKGSNVEASFVIAIAALLQRPPPRWTITAHPVLSLQPKYRHNLGFLVWCIQRTKSPIPLPNEMIWHILGFLKLSTLAR